MLAYSIIMFAATVLFLGLSAAIYRGNIHLIHEYHRKKVKDEDIIEYGKSFAKGLFLIALSTLFSGTVALLGETVHVALIAVGSLFIGILIASISIARVQKKLNGGF